MTGKPALFRSTSWAKIKKLPEMQSLVWPSYMFIFRTISNDPSIIRAEMLNMLKEWKAQLKVPDLSWLWSIMTLSSSACSNLAKSPAPLWSEPSTAVNVKFSSACTQSLWQSWSALSEAAAWQWTLTVCFPAFTWNKRCARSLTWATLILSL